MRTTVLTEQMDGVMAFDSAPDQSFVLRLCAPATEQNPVARVRSFSGTLCLSGHAGTLPCDGVIELHPAGPLYEFRFHHPTLGPVEANGRKQYRMQPLHESLTRCPLTLYQAATQQPIGTGHMTYTQPLWHFPLESFALMPQSQLAPLKNAFSTQPFAGTQYQAHPKQGFYESWFVRANHPTEAKALWIRYTRFIPRSGATPATDLAEGELWAIWFDGSGEDGSGENQAAPVTAYQRFKDTACRFDAQQLSVDIAGSRLDRQGLTGQIQPETGTPFRWALQATGENAPLLLLPEKLYTGSFPKAKSLVLDAQVMFNGTLTVGEHTFAIDQWRGSLNHNWGTQHTDEYAWGQVAGFDEHPDVFLECATARLHFGPLKSPSFSPIVLKVGHDTLRFNQLTTSLKNSGRYQLETQGGKPVYVWSLKASNHRAQINIRFTGEQAHFAALDYRNPTGGVMRCMNSKIAQCEVTLKDRTLGDCRFRSSHSAAFEILSKLSP